MTSRLNRTLGCAAWAALASACSFASEAASPADPATAGAPSASSSAISSASSSASSSGAAAFLPLAEPNPASAKKELHEICPHIFVDLEENKLSLGEMEKRLACGDKENDAVGRPWARIPPTQAAYFLRSFLQTRGRHQPQFSFDGDDLFVRVGPEAHLSTFEIRDAPAVLHFPRKREIQGRLLAPAFLNELETWGLGEIKHQGYACGHATAEADAAVGGVRLVIAAGERERIERVDDVETTGLGKFILDRYDAFEVGEYYDQRLIELTRRRILDDGFLETISINPACFKEPSSRPTEPGKIALERDAVLGPSRLAKIGVGASTEEGLRLRAQLRFLRLDERASQAQASLDASFRRQSIDSDLRWRYSEKYTRSYLSPAIGFVHDLEPFFETQTTTAKVIHGWTFEFPSGSSALAIGPGWQETIVTQGVGPGRLSYFFGDGDFSWQSHGYEYFKTSPREGLQSDLHVQATQKDLGAPFDAQIVTASGECLFDAIDVDPPRFILAGRWSLGTTFLSADSNPSDLPVNYRFFSGGIEDLRGFSRESLPSNQQGALTRALGGIEARFYRALFRRVDPILFLDAGKLGGANASLDPALYWSPGFGLRYESPIGTFRGFLAQGVVDNPTPGLPTIDRRWVANLTYGEEF